MIISRLNGGLGNQMFQFALGYKMSRVLNTELLLDLTLLKTDKLRSFGLGSFNISNKTITIQPEEMSFFKRFFNRIPSNWRLIIEKNEFQYDENILLMSGNLKLHGYWQCPKYFNELRSDLISKYSILHPSEYYKKKCIELLHTNSVSIHVRRGDYVHVESTNKVHGTCDMAYYLKAMQLIYDKAGKDICFYVFSDDVEWCKKEFSQFRNLFILKSLSDHEDMLLMSSCKHNIIANSSFSWWGAWLNQNPTKIVIAPEKWMNNKLTNTKELIPDEWFRI